ncbi:DNA repair protein [Basidiobolus meristosporus CBS 931.73]|uniref:DNA repair protein REV1 n=1 Tax=Basidiobolus meristosporus CBS 931.73 TaxID=1314790 RepID=A0A1Y1Z879_9FUNG|nr:DNA repair protein [Basidiobolus meristosporus CBS 931.73]|eukprot:ORY06463.1 DNA repair protein [Basidiobolus meristosporus CBS 931.73]
MGSFSNFKNYMDAKKTKLEEQFELEREASFNPSMPESKILKGVAVHVNGYTSPSTQEIKKLLFRNGGTFEQYFSRSKVTHVIASNLPLAKVQTFKNVKVVKPNWLVDSIAEGKILDWRRYRLDQFEEDPKNNSIKQYISQPTPTSPIAQRTPQQSTEVPEASTSSRHTETSLDEVSPDLNPPEKSSTADAWLAENSSLNDDFLGKFYENSRLHHLSMWKNELLEMTKAARNISASTMKYKSSHITELDNQYKTIMHVDMDCFFVSVSLLERPELAHRPVGVSHSQGNHGSSDVASCNYLARKYGIRNGMSIGTAKQKCADLVILPYDFAKYKAVSLKLYEIFGKYTDKLQPVSCDEAFLDVSHHISEFGTEQALELAKSIRDSIYQATFCHASVGISSNILLARLATKHAKPAGQYYLRPEEAISFLDPRDVDDLPGVGWALRKKLAVKEIQTCRDLRGHPLASLQKEFGNSTGQMLYNYCRGIDHRELQTDIHLRKSIGTNVSWGIRFETEEQVLEFLEKMSEEVSKRMKNAGVRGKNISLRIYQKRPDAKLPYKHLGHGECDIFGRSQTLPAAIDEAPRIAKEVIGLFRIMKIPPKEVRGIGIHFTKLTDASIKDGQQPTLADFVKGQEHRRADKQPLGDSSVSNVHPIGKCPESSTTRETGELDAVISKSKSPSCNNSANVDTSTENTPQSIKKKPKLGNSPSKAIQTKLNFAPAGKRNCQNTKPSSNSLPWAEIDLATLKELPQDIQQEIKAMYKLPADSENPTPVSPENQPTSRSKNTTKETESLARMDASWDPEVFQQLPSDIRQELMNEWRLHNPGVSLTDDSTSSKPS